MFIATILSKFFTFFYRLVLARGFSVSDYGTISLVIAIVSIISSVLTLALPTTIERYVSFHKNNKSLVKGIISFAIVLSTVFGLIGTALLVVFSGTIAGLMKNPEMTLLLKVVAIAIPIIVLFQIYNGISRAFKKIEYQAYTFSVITPFVNLAGAFIAVFFNLGVLGIILTFVLANLSGLVVNFVLVQKNLFDIFSKIKPVFINMELLSFSLPLVIGSIMAMAITWTDTLMLGYFMTPDIVGVYNVAVPTSLLLIIAPTLATALFLPIISHLLSKNNISKVHEAYTRISRWILLLNVPLLLVMTVFGAQIISFIFGPAYVSGGTPLMILSFGYFMFALAMPLYRMAELFKFTKMYFYVNLCAAVLNIVLCWFWIPRYGMTGAAVASALSLVLIWAVYYVRIYKKLGKHQFDMDLFRIILIAVIPAAIIYFAAKFALGVITPLWMIPMAAIYGLVYLGLIYKFGIIKPDELELLKIAFGRINVFAKKK